MSHPIYKYLMCSKRHGAPLMRTREKIALDIDDTLADVQGLVINRLRKAYGVPIAGNVFTDWYVSDLEANGITRTSVSETYVAVWDEEWRSIPALASKSLIVEALKYYDIDIVTSKSGGDLESFKRWLEINYTGVKFGNILHVKSGIEEKARLGCDIYIDDAPSLAELLLSKYRPKKAHVSYRSALQQTRGGQRDGCY